MYTTTSLGMHTHITARDIKYIGVFLALVTKHRSNYELRNSIPKKPHSKMENNKKERNVEHTLTNWYRYSSH